MAQKFTDQEFTTKGGGGGGGGTTLTTKGDLHGYGVANIRIPVGVNDQVLTADSAQALGVKWAAGGSGGPGTSTVSVVGSSTSINTTSHSLTIPGGQASGDIMFVFAVSRNSTIDIPSGSGWVSILDLDTSTNEWVKVWYKIAAASEPTITVASSAVICSTALIVLTGQHAIPIYDEGWLQEVSVPPLMETKSDSFTLFYYLNAFDGTALFDMSTGGLSDSYTKELSVEHVIDNDAQLMIIHRDSQFNGAAAPVIPVGGRLHQYQVLGAIILESI